MKAKLIIIFLNLIFLVAASYYLIDEFFRDRSVEWRNTAFMDDGSVALLVVVVIGSIVGLVRQFVSSKAGFVVLLMGAFINPLVILYSIFSLFIGLIGLFAFVTTLEMIAIAAVCMGVMGGLTLYQIFKRERAFAKH